jgi:hypothetical protein
MSEQKPAGPAAPSQLEALPGAEVVLTGIADLSAGRTTVNAIAVQCAAARLSKAGIELPGVGATDVPAAHRLYERLSEELGSGAHSRYNAILSRVASFAAAAARAQRG